MSDQAEKLEQFKAVTGANDERARFYMDSATWNLEMALASFFDGDLDPESNSDVEILDEQPESEQPDMNKPKSHVTKPSSKFATIHTINNSSDEEEEGQAFYAGGSENSGQQVLGPKKKDFVQDMFKSVKEHGVEVLDKAGSSKGSKTFQGTGYKLGQTSDDTQEIPGAPKPTEPKPVVLKLWRDGFSVDGGELRLYTDPANQDFLNSIRRGEIPQELRRGYNEVHVSMEDHRMEEFTRAGESRSNQVFRGQGHTLGSPAPPTVGAPSPEDANVNENQAKKNLNLDNNQPTTNLQIRLADGSRIVGVFNHRHTIQEVRNYIISARPQYETRSFTLMTAYPPKELVDTQTIEDAGILNSAIIQKLT